MHKLLESAIPLGPEKAKSKVSKSSDTVSLRSHSIDPVELTKPGATFASVENLRCPHHFALPIQYFCLDCKDGEGCFCSECALTRHATCDVRTLEEAYTTVLNNVIRKWASQFSSRADGLELTFAQQLEDKREEWSMKLQEAQSVLNRMCDDVTTTVRELETSLTRWLNQSHRSFAQEHDKIRDHVESTLESYAKNADMLRQQRRLPAARMLLFYNENHVMLRELLLGTTPRDSERMIAQATRHLGVRLDNINATAVEYSKLIRQLERNIRHAEGC
ncbi:tripartite motif containing protein, putative [Babesia ovata]|uniref:Tripartite motif containing protein, putative n=1 Tax=Babesia ovata TaxID=189622 RepID=A0A2H6KA27_9APIC|nr:tripartite motif containing protein, putative [Babesia ovata]GBE59840.1 tripartite motif containing protein, putative [Babesia ovata]